MFQLLLWQQTCIGYGCRNVNLKVCWTLYERESIYLLHNAPLAEIIRSHGLDYHFCADDTQLYISFKDCDVDVSRLRVENCVSDICHWMDVNELKLNHDKTEIMLIYWKYHTRPLFSSFSMGNERLTTTANARSLGVVLDDNMLFDEHVSDICRPSFIEEGVIHRGRRLENISQWNYYYTVRSDDVKVLKLRRNFVKTKATTPTGNNIYTLLITLSLLLYLFHLSFKLYFSHTTLILRLGHLVGGSF